MSKVLLTLNAGSSSLKFALFPAQAPRNAAGHASFCTAILRGEVENIGAAPHFFARDARGAALADMRWQNRTHEELLGAMLDWIETHLGHDGIVAAGHRVVHGGTAFANAARVTPAVLQALRKLACLAPLHQPHNLAAIEALGAVRADMPQIACFDTGFHRTMPELATRYALPREITDLGVRRYGFHGLSYAYIAENLRARAPGLAAGRVIAAHLGGGASLCAMRDGRSIDTTMGFTALEGLMMGTRAGSLDPGVVLYLLQGAGKTADAVADLLYHRCGLLGVSEISDDMRTLETSTDPRARDAVALFAYRAAREAGGLVASLGGLDGLVFSAGIGEHSARARAEICSRLGFTGLALDPAANAKGEGRISMPGSPVEIWVIPTDEEAMIARLTQELLAADPPPNT